MTKKEPKVTNFPENKKVREKLRRSDPGKIAEMAEVSVTYVRDMLRGRRAFTDEVSRAIIELLDNRKQLSKTLEEIVNQ